MGELAPEFKQKIANFDGHADIDSDEKAVIFYVESWARNMPPEYLDKLIDAIREKLKDKRLNTNQIRLECENAIKILNDDLRKQQYRDNNPMDNVKKWAIGIVLWKDGKYNDSPKEEATRNFEDFLSSWTSLKNYSATAIGGIFSYIFAHSSTDMGDRFKGKKNGEALRKFTERMKQDPEWLVHISKNWGNGAKDGIDRHLQFEPATKVERFIIRDSMGEAMEWAIDGHIDAFLKAHNIDSADRKDIVEDMKRSIETNKNKDTNAFFNNVINDFSGILKGKGKPPIENLDNMNLLSRLLKLEEAKTTINSRLLTIENPELKDIFTRIDRAETAKERASILAEVQKKHPDKAETVRNYINGTVSRENMEKTVQVTTSNSKTSANTIAIMSANNRDYKDTAKAVAPSQELTRSDDSIRALLNLKEGVEVTDEHRKKAESMLAWRTDRESIALIASIRKAPELRTQEKREFIKAVRNIDVSNTELDKILRKEWKNIDDAYKETAASYREKERGGLLSWSSVMESIQWINKDNPTQTILLSTDTAARIQWISDDNYTMTIQIKGRNETVYLSQEELIGYTESFRFLGEIGLGYLVENIHPTTLSRLIRATSRDGDVIDNTDGKFDNHEKTKLLISLGKIFDIENMQYETNMEGAGKIFENALRQENSDLSEGFRKIARKNGFISDTGDFNLMKFENTIRSI